MRLYILTSAAVLTEDGEPDYPEIQTKAYLSEKEAQNAMVDQLEREVAEAEANDYEIHDRQSSATGARLSYSNVSQTDIIWDITEQDIPVSTYSLHGECDRRLVALVLEHGKESENGHSLIIPESCIDACIGGWSGEESERVKRLDVNIAGGFEIVSAVHGRLDPADLPSDDLQHLLEAIVEDIEYISLMQEYFQPEIIKTKDVPQGLASFHVFPTKEDCSTWMDKHGYLEGEYTVETYHGDDIEDPTFINGDGVVIYDTTLP